MNIPQELNKEELKKMLKRVVWDYHIDEDELLEIFLYDKKGHAISGSQLKARLLNTYNWYYLLTFFGRDFATGLLKDEITRNLFPKSLKDKYVRARHILSI